MARNFSGSGQYLGYSGVAVTAAPLTMACWFNAAAIGSTMLSLGNSAGGSDFEILLGASGAVNARCSPGAAAATSTQATANVWYHAAGVFASSTSRTAYLNGGGAGSNSTSGTPSGLNQTGIGQLWINSHSNLFQGKIAEAAVWNAALAAAEIAALAAGALPRHVRPQNLVAYWPLFGLLSPEPDLSGNGQSLTVTGATAANHAPVTLFTRKARTPCDVFNPAVTVLIHPPHATRPRLHPAYLE